MSRETSADPEVRDLLDRYAVFVMLDVTQEQDAAQWFQGHAVPDT